MTFTKEQIEEILEKAMQNCIEPETDESSIARYMHGSFNNGIRMMQKETIYQILLMEYDNILKEAEKHEVT